MPSGTSIIAVPTVDLSDRIGDERADKPDKPDKPEKPNKKDRNDD